MRKFPSFVGRRGVMPKFTSLILRRSVMCKFISLVGRRGVTHIMAIVRVSLGRACSEPGLCDA